MEHIISLSALRALKALLVALTLSIAFQAVAEETDSEATDGNSDVTSDIVEVEQVKEKYWAQGDASQLGVVQNRLYTKKNKVQIGVLLGKAMDDPFLSSNILGLNLSYNVSEFWGFSVVGWDYSVSPSNALNTLRAGDKEANTVENKSYYGAEATGSFLYGKLSLVGTSIIYYDMHFLTGMGLTKTENDSAAFTVNVGIGQRFYVTESVSLRMDYRVQSFNATEVEKEITARIGEVNGVVRHWNHVVGLEVNYMFDLGGVL